jgi:hypothetical protein
MEMKFAFYSSVAILIFIGGYNYGLRIGIKRETYRTIQYQKLYDQAIQWQHTQPIPHISKNIKLKEKDND